MKFDWVVVGAGLTGATLAERIATQKGQSVLVVEQRDHIAGNAYDEFNEHGVLEHKYGPHIFHTNSQEVWHYLSQFTDWRPYFHRVLASVDGKLVPVPFNLNSIEALFPADMANRLCDKLVTQYGFGARVPILKLRQVEDADLAFLANYVYKKVFESYTKKQWNMLPDELSPAVTARVPILVSRDDRYFQDTYQAMPKLGYTAMVRRMLGQPGIKLMLNTRWQDISEHVQYDRLVFTGPIDEYFEFKHGELPYRSLRFAPVTVPATQKLPVGTVNFPTEYDYTRVTDMAHLCGQDIPVTTLFYEYPQPHVRGSTVPYYPIPTDSNRAHFAQYELEAEQLAGQVMFAGRLADYQYYNMDQAVGAALSKFAKLA